MSNVLSQVLTKCIGRRRNGVAALQNRLCSLMAGVLVVMVGFPVVGSAQTIPSGPIIGVIPGITSLIAGSPTGGPTATPVSYSGVASAALFSGVQRVAQDTAGNIYLADYMMNVIRKIDNAGRLTTFAGTGAVAFNGPYCVFPTPDGSVYVCDLGNRAVRKISNTGVITLIGGGNGTGSGGDGGSATAAQFGSIHDLWVDALGNVYLADYGNSAIRVIYAGGTIPGVAFPVIGNVYRIAGTLSTPCTMPSAAQACGDGGVATSATLNAPESIAVDSRGNIYIADANDMRVRVVYVAGTVPGLTNPIVGNIYTVVGTGVTCGNSSATTGACGDGGPAVSATVTSPVKLALDGGSNLYFSDRSTGRIRRINSSGIINTVAGGGPGTCAVATETTYGSGCNSYQYKLYQPSGIWLSADGSLLAMVNAYSNNVTNGTVVEKISLSASALSFAATVQPVGSTSVLQPVTVMNLGTMPISLSKVTIISGFAQRTSGGIDCSAGNLLDVQGSCTLDIGAVPAIVGSYTGSATMTSNASNAAGGSTIINLTGTGVQTTTTTALTVSPNPANPGNVVTFTAKVSEPVGSVGVPTGAVIFKSGGAATLGTSTLDATGTAVYSTSSLVLGTYSITAVYAGDTGNAGSTSNATSVNITSSPLTTTVLTVTPTTVIPGGAVVLKATVVSSAGVPTGTVTFYDATTFIATVPLSSGSASYTCTTLPQGINPITAVYPTFGGYAGSTSSAISVTVAPEATLSFIPGIISTIIGTASTTGGYSGDGGQGIAALLNTPASATGDALGNYYIADTKNNIVRKVTATGVITTIAGNYALGAGFSGDNGLAVLAQLNQPMYARADSSGNVYIADMGNHAIRLVYASTGIITTYAGIPKAGVATQTGGFSGDGGAANKAALNGPRGVAFDNSGNLLIGDYGNNVVRRVGLTSGTIQTIAGTPGQSGSSGDAGLATRAVLTGPRNAAADADGNIYIADAGAYRVRVVYVAGKLPGISSPVADDIYTITGTGSNSATGDGGPAVSASVGVADLAVDSSGQIYIADNTGSIRKIDLNGIVTRIAGKNETDSNGNGGTALSALIVPSSIAFDNNNNLILTDSVSNTIRRIAVNASSIIFPTQYLNQTSAVQRVVISNTGTQPLNITGLAITRGFTQVPSGGSDCGPMSLDAGAYCQIAVTYTSSTAGTDSGTITITSNASNESSGKNVISLTGTSLVAPASLTLLTISANPAVAGEGIAFTATVKSGASAGTPIPAGTVQFLSGMTVLSTQALNSAGVATFTTSALPTGTHSITASYQGDLSNLASTSTPISLTIVSKLTSTTALTLSTGTTIPGASVTFTAVVGGTTGNPLVPGSIVNFMNGANVLGQALLDNTGIGIFATSSLALGTYNITAAYLGDDNFAASVSSAMPLAIKNLPVTTTNLTATPASAIVGSSITLSATVSPSVAGITPTGTVTFFNGAVIVATLKVNSAGVATTILNNLAMGSYSVHASYSGDASSALSTSADIAVTVKNNPVTQLSLTSLASTLVSGQVANYVAQFTFSSLNTAPPSGTVTFIRTSTGTTTTPAVNLGTAVINSLGVATYAYSEFPLGTYEIMARYAGDSNYTAVTSSPVALTITASNYVVVALTMLPDPSTPQDSKTLRAIVSPHPTNPIPTGTVTFYQDTTALGTVALDNTGTANLPYTQAMQVGTYSFTVVYSGDSFYPSGISSVLSAVVWDFTLTPTQTSLTGAAGGSVSTSFNVTPINNFAGQINFACTGLPAGATCIFAPPTLSPASVPSTEKLTIKLANQVASLDKRYERNECFAAVCSQCTIPLLAGLFFAGFRRRFRVFRQLSVITIAGFFLCISILGCGGTNSTTSGLTTISVKPGTYSIVVNAAVGADLRSFTITLTVQ